MSKSNEIDNLITSCILFLQNKRFLEAAGNLQSIAVAWSKCGMELKSFLDMKSYIIESARKESNTDDLENKLLSAEKELKKMRQDEWQNQKVRRQYQQH